MANLGEVLAKFPHAERILMQVVFVTTDPERDTPERLRAWLDHFDARFIGLTGELEEVNRIQNALGLPAAIRDTSTVGADRYLVGHAAQVLAFTPDGIGRIAYPFGTRQEDWMHDLPRLLKHEGWVR
jgi:protein SCO1/2